MTQETEDVVVAKLLRYESRNRFPDNQRDGHAYDSTAAALDKAADLIERRAAERQSLFDRIDVLARERDHWKAECKALCDVVSEHTKARAALHQEGIAMKSDPLRFGVETRVNLARSQNTPDSLEDG